MSDGSLSQAEIDALLMGSEMGSPIEDEASSSSIEGLSPFEIAKFESIMNEILQTQARKLSKMVGDTVEMQNASIDVVSRKEFVSSLDKNIVEARLNFQDQISGNHSYIIDIESAKVIASLMMGQKDLELNEAALSAIEEAANTMAGSAATIIGDKTDKSIMISQGNTRSITKQNISFPSDEVVRVTYKTKIDGKEPADFIEAFDKNIVQTVLKALNNAESSKETNPDNPIDDITNFITSAGNKNDGAMNADFGSGHGNGSAKYGGTPWRRTAFTKRPGFTVSQSKSSNQ